MELNKEFLELAVKEAAYEYNDPVGFSAYKSGSINGAQSYANAVEALIKNKIEQSKIWQEFSDVNTLELLLEDLKTLKPTTNE